MIRCTRHVEIILCCLTLCAAPLQLFAQDPADAESAKADSLLKMQRWGEAAGVYEAIVKNEAGNAKAWYGLGQSRYSLKQYLPAVEAFERSNGIAANPLAMYNIACCYAMADRREKAIEWLGKAVEGGLPIYVNPAGDSDLGSLAHDERFTALTKKLDMKRRPCLYSPEFRQFDFWIGHWDVFNPAGTKVGTSIIEQAATGCAILENWTNTFGGNGRSLNFYDGGSGKWYQYWIGATGQATRYSGTFRDGAMRYETEPVQTANGTQIQRLTFYNLDANTVRQYAEKSDDGGKSWSVVYDFKYVRTQ